MAQLRRIGWTMSARMPAELSKVAALPASGEGSNSSIGLQLVFVLAVTVGYMFQPTKDDISWLLVAANALLDGKTLYVDILETNPPLSVLLYLPAAFAERVSGVRAEIFVIVQTTMLALLCIEMMMALLRRSAAAEYPEVVRWVALVVTLLLPMGAFGQKDHLAFVASLPMLAFVAAQERPAADNRPLAAAVGLLAGLAMCIKPQFALAFALPAIAAAGRRRRIGLLFTLPVLVAGFVVIAYIALILLLFPAFVTTMLPMLNEIYRPVHMSRLVLLEPGRLGGHFVMAFLLGVLLLKRGALAPWPLTLLLAGVGFFLAFMEQAKGWTYHIYPAMAAVMLAILGTAVPDILFARRPKIVGVIVRIVPVVMMLMWCVRAFCWTWLDFSPLVEAVRAQGIAHPRILTIAASHGTGHPLTRDAGGVWVGTLSGRWITACAMMKEQFGPPPRPGERPLEAWVAADRAYLERDLVEGRPDLILIQRAQSFDWLDWARQDRVIAKALAHFHKVGDVADPESGAGIPGPSRIEIWRRTADH